MVGYISLMASFFTILLFVFMAATALVLVVGLISMAKGGEFNLKYGNKLMRARVFLQGATLLCFVLALMARTGQ